MNTVETNTIKRSLQKRWLQRGLNVRDKVSRASVPKHPVVGYVGKHTPHTQSGVALVISLVLLAVMTIIGVATLSGTRLNEQMASNAQQKSIAFEAAESAIESISDYDVVLTAITSDPNAAFDNPAQILISDAISRLEQGYDLLEDNKGIDIEGTLGVQYCGEMQPVGTSLNAELNAGVLIAGMVDINSVVGIANTSAKADHLRRVSIPILQTGRTGNCPVR